MMDEKGRPWFTARVRPRENPDFCKKGSNHPSAKAFPIDSSNRHLSMYDPASGKFTLISTCFPTHHLIFAEDANNTLWTSSGGSANGVVGWLDRPMFDNTGDEVRSQGWTPFIIDTNGNGKRDEYVEPNQPVDPAKDKRVHVGFYSVAVNPVDSTVWGTSLSPFPGYAVRLAPGADPTHTALTEIYEPPLPGYGPRGGDIDRNGVFWSSLSSGHPAAFDRRKCKGPLNGPKAATGRHCPEGWTYPIPGPNFRDITETGSAESSYYSIYISIVKQFSVITMLVERHNYVSNEMEFVLHLDRSVRHLWVGQERTYCHRQSQRCAVRAGERQMDHPARAVSERLLYQVGGWPNRQSEHRLERKIDVDHVLDAHHVPPRRRHGE